MEASVRRTLTTPSLSPAEKLRAGREILRLEAVALWKLSDRLGESFTSVVDLLYACNGCVIVTGMGKAGHVGRKIAATMASVGTRAHFVHPGEAFHGDLGKIHCDDIVLMLTQSGETSEVVQLLPSIRDLGVPLVAVTASRLSTVGRVSTEVLELGQLDEAGPLGLAPSTSTTAMLALGDALALVLSRMRGFRAEDFARIHPGGSLGRKLSKVDDHMRPLNMCRLAKESQTVRQVLVSCGQPGRRTGAIMLTSAEGQLTGLFTDSDLARLFERRQESALDGSIRSVMVADPLTVFSGTLLPDAISLLVENKISELPVIDPSGKPIGLIDVTDVMAMDVNRQTDPDHEVSRSVNSPTMRIYPDDDGDH